MKIHPARWAAALCLVTAPGCLSAPDAPGYRYLVPLAVERADAAQDGVPQRIFVRDVVADEGARELLAWRTSPTRVELRSLDRWAIRPADFVRRAAHARLDGAYGTSTDAAPIRTLDLEIVHFGGAGPAEAPRAEIEVFARIIEAGTGTRSRSYRVERELDAATWRDDLCRALGELTDEVLDAIVADAAP